jgi:hypothetical protein
VYLAWLGPILEASKGTAPSPEGGPFGVEAGGDAGFQGNAFSPYRCASPLLIKLRACHSSLTNDVVELVIFQISPMWVWELDRLSPVSDPDVAVVTVMVLHPCQVLALNEIVVEPETGTA